MCLFLLQVMQAKHVRKKLILAHHRHARMEEPARATVRSFVVTADPAMEDLCVSTIWTSVCHPHASMVSVWISRTDTGASVNQVQLALLIIIQVMADYDYNRCHQTCNQIQMNMGKT